MSLVFNMAGGGSSVEPFAAISVTYPAGSTCTCTDGSKTFAAPNTSGTALFIIPYAATWIVTATDGTNTTSETVAITTEGQLVSVELSYSLWLYNSGDECTDVTGGWTSSGYTMKSGSPVASGTNTGSILKLYGDSGKATLLGTNQSISFANKTKLQIETEIVSTYESYSCLTVMVCSSKTNVTTVDATHIAQSSGLGSQTLTIDVSSISSGYVVMFVGGSTEYKAEVPKVKVI